MTQEGCRIDSVPRLSCGKPKVRYLLVVEEVVELLLKLGIVPPVKQHVALLFLDAALIGKHGRVDGVGHKGKELRIGRYKHCERHARGLCETPAREERDTSVRFVCLSCKARILLLDGADIDHKSIVGRQLLVDSLVAPKGLVEGKNIAVIQMVGNIKLQVVGEAREDVADGHLESLGVLKNRPAYPIQIFLATRVKNHCRSLAVLVALHQRLLHEGEGWLDSRG